MSKADILWELPKLKPGEREEIWARLNELDDVSEDDALSPAERALLEARISDHSRHPQSALSWSELEARLNHRLGK